MLQIALLSTPVLLSFRIVYRCNLDVEKPDEGGPIWIPIVKHAELMFYGNRISLSLSVCVCGYVYM